MLSDPLKHDSPGPARQEGQGQDPFASTGDRIRHCRHTRSLSQADLGEKAGISKIMIAQWETGARNPGVDSLKALAVALDASFVWLATGVGVPFPGMQTTTERVAGIIQSFSSDLSLLIQFSGISEPRLKELSNGLGGHLTVHEAHGLSRATGHPISWFAFGAIHPPDTELAARSIRFERGLVDYPEASRIENMPLNEAEQVIEDWENMLKESPVPYLLNGFQQRFAAILESGEFSSELINAGFTSDRLREFASGAGIPNAYELRQIAWAIGKFKKYSETWLATGHDDLKDPSISESVAAITGPRQYRNLYRACIEIVATVLERRGTTLPPLDFVEAVDVLYEIGEILGLDLECKSQNECKIILLNDPRTKKYVAS